MDRIVVRGNGPLRGEVAASGSKNSALALMAASLLADGETQLENVPRLRDVDAMLELLRALGARADWQGEGSHAVRIDARAHPRPRGALRPGAQDARVIPRARPAGRALRRGARLGARAAARSACARSIST